MQIVAGVDGVRESIDRSFDVTGGNAIDDPFETVSRDHVRNRSISEESEDDQGRSRRQKPGDVAHLQRSREVAGVIVVEKDPCPSQIGGCKRGFGIAAAVE